MGGVEHYGYAIACYILAHPADGELHVRNCALIWESDQQTVTPRWVSDKEIPYLSFDSLFFPCQNG
jgi:hypothetical protein